MLSIDNTRFKLLVVARQPRQCFQLTTLSMLSIDNHVFKLSVVNPQHCSGYVGDGQHAFSNCMYSIDNIDKVVNWQPCQCCRSTTRVSNSLLSIDNIDKVVNRQRCQCCQLITLFSNCLLLIDNIAQVVDWQPCQCFQLTNRFSIDENRRQVVNWQGILMLSSRQLTNYLVSVVCQSPIKFCITRL